MSDPDLNHAREALEHLDFLVVQDIFPTATSQLADVVLPAPSFAEKDGTFTNTERRVQRVRAALPPPGEARQDWQILADLATRMGYPMHYDSPAQIMEEISSVAPSYGGIRYERLEKGGLQWPCPNVEHPGTPILHVGKFSRGLGRFMPVEHLPAAELPDAEYPLMLTTGRVLFHYHGGEMSRRSAGLDAIYPEALVEVSPEDAQRWGVIDGQPVRVTSRRGQVVARSWVTERIQPGVVFMAFHFAEAAANLLTHAALDPIAKIPEYKVCAVKISPARGRARQGGVNVAKRILIVDDDADLVLAVRMVLESHGYEVQEAANGAEGLASMRSAPPDLVLMDVMMANPLDGYYTTQSIADDPELSEIPILMISSIADTQYAASFPTDQYLNIVEFLSKPVEPEALLAKVRQWAGG